MKYNTISYKTHQNIGYLSLSTPPANSMTLEFYEEFYSFVNSIDTNEILGLIIQGEGRHFSSGADTEQLFSLFINENNCIPTKISQNSKAFSILSSFSIPVIACLKGICLGAATELALSAHYRIATENAILGLPESSFGIIPGLGGIYNMNQLTGAAKTLEFVLGGDSISAKDALNYGIIDILASKKELLEKAEKLIHSVGDNYKKELRTEYLKKV